MQLRPNDVHVWLTDLTAIPALEEKFLLLSKEECHRAQRFHSPIHRTRFVAAHSALREILSLYLSIPPVEIEFAYTDHNKPYLTDCSLQFNMAHSTNMAVYALTLNKAIGIDIEKIRDHFNPAIAKRYFSVTENQALNQLSHEDQILGFYQIWSRKEAIIKALGRGFSIPLTTFSVSINQPLEKIHLENETWSLLTLHLQQGYAAALATNQTIKTLSCWQFNSPDYILISKMPF